MIGNVDEVNNCPLCGSKNIETHLKPETFEYKTQEIIVDRCEEIVCRDCKECFFTAETSKRIEETLRKFIEALKMNIRIKLEYANITDSTKEPVYSANFDLGPEMLDIDIQTVLPMFKANIEEYISEKYKLVSISRLVVDYNTPFGDHLIAEEYDVVGENELLLKYKMPDHILSKYRPRKDKIKSVW